MTAVSMMTLPSHMTGFLHELGPSSGVYSYVSYPSTILPHTPRAKYRNELQGWWEYQYLKLYIFSDDKCPNRNYYIDQSYVF